MVKLVKADGTIAAEYSYNAWGQILSGSGSMVNMNPLRYRGYYYDTETGYYYLQSRYYDPNLRRFINSDASEIIIAAHEYNNLFRYCSNNPVINVDKSGFIAVSVVVYAGIKTLADGAISALCVAVTGGTKDEILAAFTETAVQSVLGNLFPSLDACLDIYNAGKVVIERLKKGVDWKLSLLAGAVTYALSNINVNIEDAVAKEFFECVFGTGAELVSTAINTAIENTGDSYEGYSATMPRGWYEPDLPGHCINPFADRYAAVN